MRIPLTVAFRDFPPSEAVERAIAAAAERLDRYHPHVTSCRVTVGAPHRHHRKGRLFHVRIDLTVPGAELVVNREPPERHAHENVYLAVRDAFRAARRLLQDQIRVRTGRVKAHAEAPRARVARILREEGYGFLETADGKEVYFHRNSVAGGAFARLEVGDEVRYREEEGERGPQATFVRPAPRRRPVPG
jgi:cold shock CspA family protein